MEPLIVGGGSEQAEVLYLLGVLSIMLAGLVLIIRIKGVLVLLLLLGVVAVAVGSFSPDRRSLTEPIPISPVEQRPQGCPALPGLPMPLLKHRSRQPTESATGEGPL